MQYDKNGNFIKKVGATTPTVSAPTTTTNTAAKTTLPANSLPNANDSYSQSTIDNIKNKYSTIDDIKATSAWAGFDDNIKTKLTNLYWAPQTGNTPVGNTSTKKIVADNGKEYWVKVDATGASFMWSDGKLKTFPTIQEAEDYIRKNNPTWSSVAYSDLQQKWNQSQWVNPSITFSDSSVKLKQWTDESDEDFYLRQKFADLQKSMWDSFNKLAFNNSAFQTNVEANMKAQILKNTDLQKQLDNYRNQINTEFDAVKTKFDSNTQDSLKRINELESKWQWNFDNITNLQKDFYQTQTDALNNRVGWEQAGLQGSMSARWLDQSVINDAITQAKNKHLDEYTKIKNDNVNVLSQLNSEYAKFYNDINSQKDKLSEADLTLVKDKFGYLKAITEASKDANLDMVKSAYKPYEDALNAITTKQIEQTAGVAGDQVKLDAFVNSDADMRKKMIIDQLGMDTSYASWSAMNKIDAALLNAAAQAKDYPSALAIIYGWAAKLAASGQSTPLSDAANNNKWKPSVPPKVETTSSSSSAADAALSWASNLINKDWVSLDNWQQSTIEQGSPFAYQQSFVSKTSVDMQGQKVAELRNKINTETDPLIKINLQKQYNSALTQYNDLLKWVQDDINKSKKSNLAYWIQYKNNQLKELKAKQNTLLNNWYTTEAAKYKSQIDSLTKSINEQMTEYKSL